MDRGPWWPLTHTHILDEAEVWKPLPWAEARPFLKPFPLAEARPAGVEGASALLRADISPMLSGSSQRPVCLWFPRGGRDLCYQKSANSATELRCRCGESCTLGYLFARKSALWETSYFPRRKRPCFHKVLPSMQSLKVKLVFLVEKPFK